MARIFNVTGKDCPISRAAFKLRISSYCVGSWTGKSRISALDNAHRIVGDLSKLIRRRCGIGRQSAPVGDRVGERVNRWKSVLRREFDQQVGLEIDVRKEKRFHAFFTHPGKDGIKSLRDDH